MRQRPQLSGLLWAIPYFFAAYASAILSTNAGPAASIWLPAGVVMAALMSTRPNGWPAVMIGVVAAQTLLGVLQGANLLLSLALSLTLIAAPAIALAIVVRFAQVPLHGLYFLRALLFAALIESGLAAAVNAVLLSDGSAFWASFQIRAFAHFVGIFVITPVFTTWARFRPTRSATQGVAESVIGALAFVALVPCALAVFGWLPDGWAGQHFVMGMSYVPLVLCVLVALMWGARGGVMSVLALALIALGQAASGHGLFGSTPDDPSLLGVQMYLGVASVLVLLTTTLRGHRARAMEDASRWRANMELALAGSGQFVDCLHGTGRFEWGGDLESIAGRSPRRIRNARCGARRRFARRSRPRPRRWLRRRRPADARSDLLPAHTPQGAPVFVTDTSQPIGDLDEGRRHRRDVAHRPRRAAIRLGRRRGTPPSESGGRMSTGRTAAFLIHGLGGTQFDLGSMHKTLKRAGIDTHSLTLPGHGTTPEDLAGVRAEAWLAAVTAKYREVVMQYDTVHVIGMCMGSLSRSRCARRKAMRADGSSRSRRRSTSTAGLRRGIARSVT